MDHKFIPSQLNSTRCAKCKYDEISHTERATCECCSNSGNMEIFTDMLMCTSCIELEMKAVNDYQSPDKQQARLDTYHDLLNTIRNMDNSVNISSDIFNADTLAIVEIEKIIANDDTIENKPYRLAEILHERYTKFSNRIFEINDQKSELDREKSEIASKQKAIQLYFNQLSNKLRAEEREKFKIADINYQPAKPTLVKPKNKKPATVKFDRNDVAKYAALLSEEVGIPVTANQIQTICIRRNVIPEVAANILREMLNPPSDVKEA